jgi:raffinose/stachyose/melibiose transport system substrate-binding protein
MKLSNYIGGIKMKKKILVLLCVLLAAAFCFAACTPTTEAPSGDAAAAESSGSNAAATDESSGETSSSGGQTVLTFQSWTPTEADMENMIARFNETYPDIKVEVKMVPFADHYTLMKSDIAAGEAADIVGLQPGASINQYTQFFTPVAPFAEEEYGEGWKEMFTPRAIELATNMDGDVMGMPMQYSLGGTVWYNKDMFEEMGIEVPTTYDELKAACDTIRANGKMPMMQGARDAWTNIDFYHTIVNDLAPGKMMAVSKGEGKWTDPEMVEAFEWWKKYFDDGIFQDGALGMPAYNDAYTLFLDQEGAMIPFGSWQYNIWNIAKDQAEAGNWGVMRMPDMNGDGQPAALWDTVGQVLCISKDCENKEAAWKFIKFFADDYAQEYLDTTLMDLPVKQGVTALGGDWPENCQEIIGQYLGWANEAVDEREMAYPELTEGLGNVLAAIAEGTMTPEEAAQEMQEISDSISR